MSREAPIACTLTADELPARMRSARELGERALVGVEVSGRRALLRFTGERERIDALVAAERRCCEFLSFEIEQDGERVNLEILTPAGGEPILRGLVAGVVAGWQDGLGAAPPA